MTTNAAIPTLYKGIQMRSRLEARWAAYFDLLKQHDLADFDWQYEPIDLRGWIPDFQIEDFCRLATPSKTWCASALYEIKPVSIVDFPNSPPVEVVEKIERAISKSEKYFVFICGVNPGTQWCRTPIRHPYTRTQWGTLRETYFDWRPIWSAAGNAVQWKAPEAPREGFGGGPRISRGKFGIRISPKNVP